MQQALSNATMLTSFTTLREKCPYSELFWSTFSRIRTEQGEIVRISPYLVQMRENADQNNSEYGHFIRSASFFQLRQHVYIAQLSLGNIWNFRSKYLKIYLKYSKKYISRCDKYYAITLYSVFSKSWDGI